MTFAVALLSGLCAFASVSFALRPSRRGWVRGRLAPYVPAQPTAAAATPSVRGRMEQLFEATESFLGSSRPWRAFELACARAGISLRPVELAYAALVSCVALVLLMLMLGTAGPALLLAPVATAVSLALLLTFKARRRRQAFDEQLPQILDSLAAGLKVGHSLTQSLQAVTADASEPAAGEFERVLGEARLGRPLEVAFEGMAERVGSEDFAFVLTSITVQRQVGGSLATLLETVAETVRRRQQFARKLQALTSMGRISARVLMALPFVVAALLTAVNSHYMRPLVVTRTGQMLIVVAVAMLVSGSLILKRIVSLRS